MIYSNIEEAKRIKGKEYNKYHGGNRGTTVDDEPSSQRMATTTLGKGGVLDSVAQHHIEDLDVEKEKAILESKDLFSEYLLYASNNINEAINKYGDPSKSQLEKRMVEDIGYLQSEINISNERLSELILGNYYGYDDIVKDIDVNKEKPSQSDLEIINKRIKMILRMRMNYVNKITELMSKMLKVNYKVLGLSEEQAEVYINSLKSGTNDSVKTAGDIKELIKKNSDKFMINSGEGIDLRQLGFGVILGPTEGYELRFAGTDGSNKDGMLSLLQSAMRYDAVVVAHGGDETDFNKYDELGDYAIEKMDESESKSTSHMKNILERKYDNKSEKSAVSDFVYLTHEGVKKVINNVDIEKLKKEIRNSKNKNDIDQIVSSRVDKGSDILKNLILKFANKKEDKIFIETYKKYNSEFYTYIEYELTYQLYELVSSNIKVSDFDYWYCQPTKTLNAGPFTDVNDVVRELIKEGFKKILIEDCNPGGHKLADDIMKTKGILINHSDFSNYVESVLLDTNDEAFKSIVESERSLIEFAEAFDIDYNDDTYLTECCEWCNENYELIEEGIVFDTLKEFFKKVLGAIIGFFKAIINFIKNIFIKLKNKIKGTKEEPKNQSTKFQKPIEAKIIDIDSKKVEQVKASNREDLDKIASETCTKFANKSKSFNQKQQESMKKIQRDIDKLEDKLKRFNESFIGDNEMDNYKLLFENDYDDWEYLAEFDAVGDDEPATEETDEDEYSIGDEAEETTPEPAQEETPAEDTGEDDYDMGEEGEEPQEETPTEEPPEDEGETPEDDEYEIPDDEGQPEGEEPETPGEDTEGGTEDDEYSMDDADSPDGGGEEPTDDTSLEEPAPDESNIDTKLKDLETVLFDNLSETDKKMKIKELKELYINVYNKCDSILELISNIQRDEETIQIIEYISNTLIDLKKYVNDYINDVFDSKTYMENLSQLQKYIMIFNAINKVFEQIKQENHE